MNNKFFIFLKIIFLILALFSISIMLYFEFYLWMFWKEKVEKVEKIVIEEELEIIEKLEKTINFIDLIKENKNPNINKIWDYLSNILDNNKKTSLELELVSIKKINNILWGDYLIKDKKQTINIYNYNDWKNKKIIFKGFFNSVAYELIISSELNNSNYIIEKINLDWLIALFYYEQYFNYKNEDFSVNYTWLVNQKFNSSFSLKRLLDLNLWYNISIKIEKLLNILAKTNWLIENDENSITIWFNKNSKLALDDIIEGLDLTLWQKSEIKKDFYKIYKYIENINILINNHKINIKLDNNELIIKWNLTIEKNNEDLEVISKKNTKYSSLEKLKEKFIWENKILYNFLNNKWIIDIIYNNL